MACALPSTSPSRPSLVFTAIKRYSFAWTSATMTEGAEGEEEKSQQTTGGAPKARPRHPCSGAPQPLSPPFFAHPSSRKPKPRGILTKGYSRSGRRAPREKELSGGRNLGNSSGGEIDAIAIVIERDIISIIIIIISTIYTAITTAAPRHRCISMNEVMKKLFTISLSGKAAHWYKLLKNGDSIDWEDIVPLFYSKFYPPSEIHKDRNRIYNFWPHDGESIAQAWGRLKSLMLKCPIHELPGNVIIDNFYARLSFQDKTLLDTSCSGSFTRKNEEFKRDLLDRIQENMKDGRTTKIENQQHLENSESEAFRKERDELEEIFRRQPILKHDLPVEDLGTTPPPKEDPVFDLKPLPDNLKYAHIDDKKIYPVIISSKLSEIEEERLLEILKKHRGAIGYTLDDLKGISPSICQHAINMEEDAKPVVEHQRRLIPKMKEVRCEETNLVLNWEKCHFMVNEGIVLGHKISERGIEVDRAKVEAIEKMPYPRDVKGEKEPEAEEWGNNSKSWDSPSDRLLNRVEHNSEMIRNLIYRIDELQELIEKLVRNSSPPSPKE
ncbi:hypothetical protein QYE76_063472 [Lolium multiflorum]|uniref:Retrotransposon gag domain-containing protein n=1 Tax=Lolium multiflorum TaxID=4521 RepID=A0AAD8S522_LOLMU|nr:hypothetical protein QYE76_063472 [Lolium multiflorum]